VAATKAQILEAGLAVARVLGLPVTSWRVDDPTKVLFHFLAEVLEQRDVVDAQFAKSAFLSTSEGDWKTIVASEVYGEPRNEATYASSTITLLNSGGGYYAPAAGEVTAKNSATGKTYHSVDALSIAGGQTATLAVEADEAGSDSNSGIDEIDELVTTMLGVEITASTLATASDEQSDSALEATCLDSLGAVSPNGPLDAFNYAVKNSAWTGSTEITRSQTTSDSTTGVVSIYVAGASGAVSGSAVTAAQAAVNLRVRPHCVTPTVYNATPQSTPITATIEGVDVPTDYAATAADALAVLMAGVNVGGKLSRSAITSVLQRTAEDEGASDVAIVLTIPAADITLSVGTIAVPGTISITEIV